MHLFLYIIWGLEMDSNLLQPPKGEAANDITETSSFSANVQIILLDKAYTIHKYTMIIQAYRMKQEEIQENESKPSAKERDSPRNDQIKFTVENCYKDRRKWLSRHWQMKSKQKQGKLRSYLKVLKVFKNSTIELIPQWKLVFFFIVQVTLDCKARLIE